MFHFILLLHLLVVCRGLSVPNAKSCLHVFNQNGADGWYLIDKREIWCEQGWTRFGTESNWEKREEEEEKLEITILSDEDLEYISKNKLIQSRVECDVDFYAQRDDSAPAHILKYVIPQHVAGEFKEVSSRKNDTVEPIFDPQAEFDAVIEEVDEPVDETVEKRKPDAISEECQNLKDCERKIVFNNGFSNHNHYKWAAPCQSIVCEIYPKSVCSTMKPNAETNVIFTKLRFEPRSGKAVTTQSKWSKNRYTWSGTHYYAYFRPGVQTQVDSAHLRVSHISSVLDTVVAGLKSLTESVTSIQGLLKENDIKSSEPDVVEQVDVPIVELEAHEIPTVDEMDAKQEQIKEIVRVEWKPPGQTKDEGTQTCQENEDGVECQFQQQDKENTENPKEDRIIKKVFSDFPRLKWPEGGNYEDTQFLCPPEQCEEGELEDELCCSHTSDRLGVTAKAFCKENGFPIASHLYKGKKRSRNSKEHWPYRSCLVYNTKTKQWERDGRHACHFSSITCKLYDEEAEPAGKSDDKSGDEPEVKSEEKVEENVEVGDNVS